jgi:hypothetical protein
MISYIPEYSDSSSRPKLIKRITTDSGEVYDTTIVFENEEERKIVSIEEIYGYLDCLILYIQDSVQNLESVKREDDLPSDGWPLKGSWGEVEWAKSEIFKWWEEVYYREEEEEAPEVAP